jgi:hypothetical protein
MLRPLVHPIKDVARRLEWAADKRTCWVCGVRQTRTPLVTHHIAHGQAGRSDEESNLFRACNVCHMRIHGEIVVVRNRRLMPIPFPAVLWLKWKKDAGHWDPERLAALLGRASLPEPTPLEE